MEDYKKKTIESYDKNAREFSEKFAGLFGDIEKHAISMGIVLPRPEDRYYEAMGIKRCLKNTSQFV